MILKNRSKNIELFPVLLLLLFAILLSISSISVEIVKKGINLWVAVVVPSLFPYLFISALCSNLSGTKKLGNILSPVTKKLFNTSGISGYLFLISTVSGYPSGAKAVADAKTNGFLSDTESVRASAFCSVASPVFLISSVGTIMFKNLKFGILLFISNFLVSIILGIIFSFYKRKERAVLSQKINSVKSGNILFDSAVSSVNSILVVGALITVFYLFSEMLLSFKILTPFIKLLSLLTKDDTLSLSIATALLEVTGGLKRLSALPFKKILLPITAFLTGFGGISVILQSVAFLKSAKIKTAPFFLSKILSAVLNFIISLILSVIFL